MFECLVVRTVSTPSGSHGRFKDYIHAVMVPIVVYPGGFRVLLWSQAFGRLPLDLILN